jgi:hypothetical protein
MTMRRDFLAFTAGAVVAKTVLPMAARAENNGSNRTDILPHPDAELLRLIAESDALTAQSDALVEGVEDYKLPCWVEAEALGDRAYEMKELAVAIPAMTADGLRAKAAFVIADLDCSGIASEMALSLARDVMAGRVIDA